ncbi:MAG: hypothetical protein J6Z79_05685 [Clostridia bacterium]|nr:hypothetical protein [Clostridia bacterium]
MNLTLDQLNACVDGIPSVVEDDGAYYFRRFTDEQRLHQFEDGSAIGKRCFQNPGCKLDFTTDSPTLTLSMTRLLSRSNIPVYAVDLWQDGVLTHHLEKPRADFPLTPEGRILPDFEETFTLLPGKKRVELFFPWNVNYRVKNVSLSDGALFEPTVHARRMIVFGDSITQANVVTFPSMTYIAQVSRAIDARTYDYAIGSDKYKATSILPGTYPEADMILVAYGTNARKISANWQKGLDAFYELLVKEFPGVPTYAVLPIHRMGEETDEEREVTLPEARRRIREKCESIPQVTVIDGETFVPWDDAMYVDGLHPNDLGHTHYAMNLIRELKKLLK